MQNNLNTLPTDHKSKYYNHDLKLKLKIRLNGINLRLIIKWKIVYSAVINKNTSLTCFTVFIKNM